MTGRTKREWEQNREALKRDHDAGTLPAPNRQTVGEYLDAWLAVVKPKLKVRAWQFYADNVRLYLKPQLGDMALTRLTEDQANAAWSGLLTRKPKPLACSTVKGIRETLVVALNAAMKKRVLNVNAAALSETPDVQEREPDTLEEDELRRSKAAVAGHPLRAFFLMMSATGCRIGEVGVRQRDLVPESGDIRIEVAVLTRGKPALDTPKSRRGVRLVPLLPLVNEAIQRYLADHDVERRRNVEAREVVQREVGVPVDTIFTRPDGMWLSYIYVERELRKVFGTTRLPRLTPHGFRYTKATRFAQRCVPAVSIVELLGHADSACMQQRYVHNNDAGRRRAKDEIAAISQR